MIELQKCVPSKSSCENEKLQTLCNVILTLEVGILILQMTHLLDTVDIYAMLFKNPSTHDKVTVGTQLCISLNS
jgi:hypothetical protein